MIYAIEMNLPPVWKITRDSYIDESGTEISHLEASLPDREGEGNAALVEVYVGAMPEGETAEDQAFANYAETVGFDEGDDSENPIMKFKFNGKPAWGFEAVTEEDYPMRFIAQEVRKAVLAIIVLCACDEAKKEETVSLIERSLRIR